MFEFSNIRIDPPFKFIISVLDIERPYFYTLIVVSAV